MTASPRHQPWLCATDLDNTLVGDARGLSAFHRWLLPRRQRWRVAFVTGRGLDSAWDLISTERLLLPDALVTDVGAMIWLPARAGARSLLEFRAEPAWERELRAQWPEEQVDRLATDLQLESSPGVGCTLRRSFRVEDSGVAELVRNEVTRRGLSVRVIYSSGRDLDLLPLPAGKGSALCHLLRLWRLPPWRVAVCGDSGNDLDMLERGFTGVVVANAQPELRQAALHGNIYRARRPYAWGVLEGLRHWAPDGSGG